MMWAAINSEGVAVGFYNRDSEADKNAGPGGRVVVLPEGTPRGSRWDAVTETWAPPDPNAVWLRLGPDGETRSAYDEALDRRLIQEVVLDVVLALAADPDFFTRLRPSTRQKIAALRDAVDEVKAKVAPRP